MLYTATTHLIYLAVSLGVTIWVAQSLHKSGRVFLVDTFGGNEALADSVNHLLVVGFYLINLGYVTMAIKYGDKPTDLVTAIEFFGTKIGLVLLVLGAMHFLNLWAFSKIRTARVGARQASTRTVRESINAVDSNHTRRPVSE